MKMKPNYVLKELKKLKELKNNTMHSKKLIKIGLVLTVFLSLQSCFTAKTYERPENVVAVEKYRTQIESSDTTNIATLQYNQLFTDSKLQGYIEEGLQNNLDINSAIQQILIAEAYVKQGKASFFPTLNANAKYTHQELSQGSQFGGQFSTLDQYELSGGLTWEADIWGKIRSNKRAFDAGYLGTIAEQQAVKSRLVANIASTYYNMLATDEQIKITEETIGNRNKSLETTKALKEAGNVTAVGVKQTEAQLYFAQALLVDLKNNARLLENTMSILLGSNPKDISRNTLAMQTITTNLPIGVPSQLLSNRPDVISAEYNLVNAFELTNVARSNFYPSLTVNATGGLQNLELDKLFNANSLFASVIAGLTQPIFNKRQIRTQYEVSQAQQEQALLNFKNSLLVASKEVSDAMYKYQAATEKIEIKEKELQAYDIATDFSEQLLDNGLANYIEVLIAQENALNASLQLVEAKNARLQAVVDLYEALGGGWR